MNREEQSHLSVANCLKRPALRGARRSGLVASAIALFAAMGCGSDEARTQVMVEVDADEDVQALVQKLTVEIQSVNDGTNPADSTITKKAFGDGEAEPLLWAPTIAIVPKNADLSRRYDITATIYNATGEAIGVQRVQSGFKPHKTLLLKLRFEGSCLYEMSLKCAPAETCEKGDCVPKIVDPNSLATLGKDTPDVILPDSGTAGAGSTTNANSKGGSGGASGSGTTSGTGNGTSGKGGSGGAAGASPGDVMGIMTGDPSMPANCGDGKITGDEKCDIAIADGQPGACPKECNGAPSPCERTSLEGSGCQTLCKPYKVTDRMPGDNCCPEGADQNSDSDCGAVCGNGLVEGGESCDPSDTCPTEDTCKSADACLKASINGTKETCKAWCIMEPLTQCASGDGCCPSGCDSTSDNDCAPPPPGCGNGTVENGERCDKASSDQGCPTKLEDCNDNNACTVDYVAGNADNCSSYCVHVPIYLPLSGDGCCPAVQNPLTGGTLAQIANANNDNDCKPVCGNGIVESGETCDGGSCPNGNGACDDGNPCTRDTVAGDGCQRACRHDAIRDARNNDGCCPANSNANANNDNDCAPMCGNRIVESGETCEPPNAGNCSGICQLPRCGDGIKSGDEQCDGTMGVTPPDTCSANCKIVKGMTCGNGKKEGTEACDGAEGVTPPDTCSASCTVVKAPTMTCGNGTKEGTEACDGTEGVTPPDTCSASCTVVRGMACGNGKKEGTEACDGTEGVTPPDTCSASCTVVKGMACGNGKKEGTEACDGTDGVTPPDACSNTCTIIKGAVCPNGVKELGEQCDGTDGVTPPDTCSATCTIIPGTSTADPGSNGPPAN